MLKTKPYVLKKTLSWRLRVMMAERDIRSCVELAELLAETGYTITPSQLTRVVRERPERIATRLLDHLLMVLDCEVSDLLRPDPAPQPSKGVLR